MLRKCQKVLRGGVKNNLPKLQQKSRHASDIFYFSAIYNKSFDGLLVKNVVAFGYILIIILTFIHLRLYENSLIMKIIKVFTLEQKLYLHS